jgi:signal transduction histidine kinase
LQLATDYARYRYRFIATIIRLPVFLCSSHSQCSGKILSAFLINQLFYNLYTNAVKYNVDGGWVEIKLSKRAHGFELLMSNPTSNALEDLAKRAFDRFYRGDSSRARNIDGIGLGLSLAQEIARVHGASLTLEVSAANIVTVRLRYPVDSQLA